MSSARAEARPRRGRPHLQDVDRHVGARLRERRIMLGVTQQQLAALVGITYQQAHKYEAGANRVSAGRLHALARALGVEVGYFFEGLDPAGPSQPAAQQRLLLELARSFAVLPRRQQEALCGLARVLAEEAVAAGGAEGTGAAAEIPAGGADDGRTTSPPDAPRPDRLSATAPGRTGPGTVDGRHELPDAACASRRPPRA